MQAWGSGIGLCTTQHSLLPQAILLMLFNDCHALTVLDLQSSTTMAKSDVVPVLHSLAFGRDRHVALFAEKTKNWLHRNLGRSLICASVQGAGQEATRNQH